MRPTNPCLCTALLIFSIFCSPNRSAAQSLGRVLYAFEQCGVPDTPLIADVRGNLYGATSRGGAGGQGCVFELSPSQGAWQQTILHGFSGPDGNAPSGALVFDKSGNLYGTTVTGGVYQSGTAFELSPSANGDWTEKVLHSFGAVGDGAAPECNLVFDSQGNLYGTTLGGGASPNPGGTVFELSPGQGGWTETILYTFPGSVNGPNGESPAGGLVMDRAGRLYGSTQWGGTYGDGAVYEVIPYSGGYREKVIYSFDGSDGSSPSSGLTRDSSGNLYGTTFFGGTSTACPFCGVVFRLSKGADGTWSEDVLHEMNQSDGRNPVGPVVFDRRGNLYAAGQFGGINNGGSVFMLTPTASGPWAETVLHLFNFIFPNGKDGQQPYAGVMYGAGSVFGTTSSGGVNDAGIVFEIAPPRASLPRQDN